MNTTTPPADAQGVLIMQRVARSLVAAEVRAVDLPGNDADQEANRYGRGWGAITSLDCAFACEPYRPRGLDRKY